MLGSCLLVDVLFEVTIEIKLKDWISHGGSELQKGLLESMKNHVSLGMGRKQMGCPKYSTTRDHVVPFIPGIFC